MPSSSLIMKLPKRYIPKILSNRDKKRQVKMINKSKKMYKKGKYLTRKKVKSFKSKKSSHITNAKKMYNVDKVIANKKLAKKTRCSVGTLRKIVQKGMGAYFSSGSRPNQTAQSWGRARLASAITGGKAAAVDLKLLEAGCKKNSKAVKLAKKSAKKYKSGRRKTPKYKVGGKTEMKEKIVKFERGPNHKKYTAFVRNNKTKKVRKINFGDNRYEQFKDRTPLGLYTSKNHGDKKRQYNYYNRHSGIGNRKRAIKKEIRKSKSYYTPKILSHKYLWN